MVDCVLPCIDGPSTTDCSHTLLSTSGDFVLFIAVCHIAVVFQYALGHSRLPINTDNCMILYIAVSLVVMYCDSISDSIKFWLYVVVFLKKLVFCCYCILCCG